MIVSPGSSSGASASTVPPTKAAGTMIQIARGGVERSDEVRQDCEHR